jgi:hypothetical protein
MTTRNGKSGCKAYLFRVRAIEFQGSFVAEQRRLLAGSEVALIKHRPRQRRRRERRRVLLAPVLRLTKVVLPSVEVVLPSVEVVLLGLGRRTLL